MATNYDIAFLRVAMREPGAIERDTALRCLQVIDEQHQRGQPVTAMEVAVRLGLMGEDQARACDAKTREELSRVGAEPGRGYGGGAGVGRTDLSGQSFRGRVVGASPPLPAQATAPPAGPPPLPGQGGEPGPGEGGAFYDLSLNGEGLDDFELGERLGRGPVGTAYRGRRKSDRAPVVVKVLSRRFRRHPEVLEQVLADVRRWRGLRTPRLAAVLAVGVSNERDVIVYEEAPGKSLARVLLEGGPLPASKALRVVYEVGLALAAAERRGLAHGDVRAEKVFYDGKHATLLDGGLARASALAQGFGQFGLPFGHPSALAPEVLQEELRAPTPATDVYALGVLFYQLVCGRLPFAGEVREQLEAHFERRLPPPPPGVTVSATVANLILNMTAKAPSQRLQGPGALVEGIQRLLQGKPLFPPPEPEASTEDPGLSKEDWGRITQEVDVSSHRKEWTASAIERAPAVGPSGLDDIDAHATSDTQRMAPVASGTEELELGRKLGRGPVGSCYEGKLGGRQVVIKVISRKFAQFPELQRRIVGAVGAAAALDHPHVLRALKAMRGGSGRELVIYERAKGGCLRDLLAERGPLAPSEATSIVLQIARALEVAGARGLCHGDLRPEKIYVEPSSWTAQVADFGLAEAACLGSGYGRYGMQFGHPAYLAPEVLQERLPAPTPGTDIYALGILYYELVCGVRPFDGEDVRAVLKAHLTETLPPPPDEVSVPGPVAEVIVRMVAKDPARRPSGPQQAIALLEPLQGLDASRELPAVSGERSAPPIEVEELDLDSLEELDEPTDQNAISIEEWDFHSENLAKPSGEWNKDKIERAPRVGPEEWSPDDIEQTQDEGHQGQTLSTVIAEATLERARKGRRPGSTRPPARGRAQAEPRPAGGEGRKPASVFLAAALLVVALGVGLVFALSGGSGTEGAGPGTTAGEVAGGGAPNVGGSADASSNSGSGEGGASAAGGDAAGRNPVEPRSAGPSREQIQAALSAYERAVEADLDQGLFQPALDRVLDLPDEVRGSPVGKETIARVENKVRAAFEEKLRAVRRRIERLVERQRYDDAVREIELMTWILREREDVRRELREQVRQARAARFAKLRSLKRRGPGLSAARIRQAVGAALSGEGQVEAFENGGCFVRFGRGDALLADLEVLAGKGALSKDRAPVRGAPPALKVSALDAPVLLLLRLPIAKLVEATLGFALARAPRDGARLCLLVGASARRPRGVGTAWGSFPVRLRRPGDLESILTAPTPPLPAREPIRMNIELTDPRRGKRFVSRYAVGDGPPRAGKGGTFKDVENLAIYAENVEVFLTSLEVGGLVDPAVLGSQ
ncbi:MAG: serine/threonine protein kinase [Planctomycetota bacterium]|nr:MAG: serine/threonine protein kinase [Planctomycetota bacterium]